jgi:hypothetical protein
MRAHLLFSDLYRRYRHILPQLMSPEPRIIEGIPLGAFM